MARTTRRSASASFIFSGVWQTGYLEKEMGTASYVTETSGGGFDISPEDLQRLARLVEENGLSELRYEEGDLRVTLRTAAFTRPATATAMMPVGTLPVFENGNGEMHYDDEAESAAVLEAEGRATVRVEAPLMGVFFRSPDPESPAFVEVGDMVEVGQVIGLIEAMKVFSEVPSDVAGRVREIPAKSGALVQPGDPLVILEALD